MKRVTVLIILCFFTLPAFAFNSQVRYEDIPKLRKAGVDRKVIDYLIHNQTLTIGSEDLLRMRKAGMTDDEMLSAIKSDLARPEEKPTAITEAELIVRLKKAGMSDEGVLQFLESIRSERRVDTGGRVIRQYDSTARRPHYPTQGAVLPEKKNNEKGPDQGQYYIIHEAD